MPRHRLTIEDALQFKVVSDAQISPDASSIAFVVSGSQRSGSGSSRARIWTVAASGGRPRLLTDRRVSCRAPRWSPDGRLLAYLSDTPKGALGHLGVWQRDSGQT